MSGKLRLADETNELHVHQRLQVRRHVHAADVLDLALGERLAIGNDGECLERRAAETTRAVHLQHGAHITPAARHGLQTISTARANELETDATDFQGLFEAAKSRVNLLRRARAVDVHHLAVFAFFRFDSANGVAQLGRRQGNLARKEKGADDLLQGAGQRHFHFFTHSRQVSPRAYLPALPSRAGS